MKKHRFNKSSIIIIVLAILITALAIFGFVIRNMIKPYQQGRAPYRYVEGKEDEFFPFDEEEAQQIEESEQNQDGETWAIYMYLNASNLELDGHNQLSDFVEYTIKDEIEERTQSEKDAKHDRIMSYIETQEKSGVPLPISFYDVDYDKYNKPTIPEETHSVMEYSWGSEILDVIKKSNLPENVTFVVQPAGAKAWKNTQVNPNRTRRFVKKENKLVEVYDAPISNMGESQTLADFLKFCKTNYPADHTMVILTDHGGAMNGFGWDCVYGDDNLTLAELTDAFDAAYGLNEENPPIDLLYYNACLMSNTDVINSMRGVTEYMIAGEEVGLSVTKYYQYLGDALCENPTANAMQIGKYLIDAYSRELTENGATIGEPRTTGMCLLDMKKAPLVYDAYADFAKHVLNDVADNPNILVEMSRAIKSSISFAVDSYKGYNVTDLWLWIAELKQLYPEDAEKIMTLIDEAVIYKRADCYLKDAHGISVHFPNYVETPSALNVALDYVENISYSEDISALYYYKIAGCMNEKYTAYCTENGIKIPDIVDYESFYQLRNAKIKAVDDIGNISYTLNEKVLPVITDVRYELCRVDKVANDELVTFYGEDRFVGFKEGGELHSDFEGKWVHIGGVPFAVNIINETDDTIMYESPVRYQDTDYKLILVYYFEDDSFKIEGLRVPSDNAATINRNVKELKPGSYIKPIYNQTGGDGGELKKSVGSSVLYNVNTVIGDKELASGTYRVRLVFEDMRGDDFYSEPVYFEK